MHHTIVLIFILIIKTPPKHTHAPCSASAGHGNLFSESYTAYMERALKPIFAAIGIEYIGKNYAMGGTSSAAEIALCGNSIFGHDVDSISWDYGGCFFFFLKKKNVLFCFLTYFV